MNKHVLKRIICKAKAFHIGHISLSDIDSQHASPRCHEEWARIINEPKDLHFVDRLNQQEPQ